MLTSPYKSEFLLDPAIHFLNHGSFGACPKPVFSKYQEWQLELEKHPVALLGREIFDELDQVRFALGSYLNCGPDDLVFFPNPTTAMNMVARSIPLLPGDEVLSTDHEYGAMDRTWRYISEKRGFIYRNAPIPTPLGDDDFVLAALFEQCTPQTKAVFLSHITSQTAVTLPVHKICAHAKRLGLTTIVDGAHAPGQVPLDLSTLQADYYVGACHKWLCAPKGASFLFAEKLSQACLDPLIVSWGYESETPRRSPYLDYHDWQGTRDYSAILAVPAAITYCTSPGWQAQQKICRERAAGLWEELSSEYPGASLYRDSSQFCQMFAIELPVQNPVQFQADLLSGYQVEVPVYKWKDRSFVRVSVQVYNDESDLQALKVGLKELMKR